MLKFLEKLYNCLYKFHRTITKKTYFGLTKIGVIFFSPMIIIYIVNNISNLESIRNVINKISVFFLFCLILLFMSYYQIISFIFKKDRKYKKMKRKQFCSNINYLKYCLKTTIIIIMSFIFILKFIFNVDAIGYFILNINILFTIIFIMFSIVSIFWFSYLLIYKLLEEQIIKVRLNLYIAIASTINLFQILQMKEYLISFGVIIVSYRWINYLIEEKKLWKQNGT